jgi:hypothetical protein
MRVWWVRGILSGLAAATVGLADASAGHKLYDMGVFLGKDRSPAAAGGMRDTGSPARQPKPVAYPGGVVSPASFAAADRPGGRTNSTFAFSDLFSEFIVGVWRHDPGQDNNESDTWDLNAEIIFRKLDLFDIENPIADFLLSPRPLIGGSVNNKNKTHTAYIGLNWRYIFDSNIFIAFSFGGAYHTGNLHRATRQCAPSEICHLPGNRAFDDDRREITLGSSVLFRESLAVGYRIERRHMVSIYAAHISNGGLADDNDGMNFIGLRYGYSLE